MPFGNIPGTWTLAFDDEFNGTSLDTTKWDTGNGGNTNNVTTYTSNVAVSGGNLILTLASSTSGAIVCSGASCNFTGSGAYNLPVGGYAEARISFPGSGTTIYNWAAWWLCGPNWPADGENDVAEGNSHRELPLSLRCTEPHDRRDLVERFPRVWALATG